MDSLESSTQTATYLGTILYYITPASPAEMFYGVWEPFISSSLCYGICLLRWGGLVFAISLCHSMLRAFSVPAFVHNGINLIGAYWLYSILSPPPSLQESESAVWQWEILGISVAALYGMVQWQYWNCQSLLDTSSNVKTPPRFSNNQTHQAFRLAVRRMNQIQERIQFLRLALIAVSSVFWCYYYHSPLNDP